LVLCRIESEIPLGRRNCYSAHRPFTHIVAALAVGAEDLDISVTAAVQILLDSLVGTVRIADNHLQLALNYSIKPFPYLRIEPRNLTRPAGKDHLSHSLLRVRVIFMANTSSAIPF
jgi:hypothetical protein